MKTYYLAEKYYGGDGPVTLVFETEDSRNKFLQLNDYCNEAGTAPESEVYDGLGLRFGTLVVEKNNVFYDAYTGIEL